MASREWWASGWDRSEYDRERYQAAKQQLIEMLGGKCTACGTTEDLQFDHVSRVMKKFAIMTRWNRGHGELAEELAKCQLLCKPCHLEKTKAELGNEHGGGKTGRRNCSCEPCRARRRENNKEYRHSRKQAAAA